MGWREKEDAKLKNMKILVVGAGGIGCELLKNLALTGFKSIHVIDLDTIDVSNLNRQFLFRREHVGQPKAKVASEAVKSFCPSVNITYTHDSIFTEQFNVRYFDSFDLVLNALDNRAARNHVNRMCLAARKPLVESGSAGYLGQVSVIIREKTECYECVDKPAAQKTFPGCTIRNTPSEHIHCTVWAKHLFNQLFGEIDIDDDVSPDMNDDDGKDSEDGEKATENENGNAAAKNGNGKEAEEAPVNTRVWAEEAGYAADQVFDKLFFSDINYLCSMDHLWKERKRPVAVRFEEMLLEGDPDAKERTVQEIFDDVNTVWSRKDCARAFAACVEALKTRKAALPADEVMSWDKDDDDAMRFVVACANIRANIFGIQSKTSFDIKAMAGNIIPAIATTNAIVAGMMVTEALKLVSGDVDKIKNVFIARVPNPRGKILSDEAPQKPNPKCYVCSDKRECYVRVNPHDMTVKALNEKVLKGQLNMLAPDVTDSSTSRIIISSEEGETDDLECKKLAELSIGDGTILDCDDFKQELEIKLIIHGSSKLKGDEFEVLRDSKTTEEAEEETRKRKADEDTENGNENKKTVLDSPPAVKKARIDVTEESVTDIEVDH